MEPKKSEVVSLRLDSELDRRLALMQKSVPVNKADIIRACLEALLTHFESKGKISFPIRITDEPEKPDAFARKK